MPLSVVLDMESRWGTVMIELDDTHSI
ncbi:MAG: hypothetical protein RLZZ602_2181, partial [Pseudomonadota bacterium]